MTKNNPSAFDQEIDLLEYIARITQAKYRLVGIASVMAILTLAITFLMPNRYTATTILAFNRYDTPGGIKPKEYRGGDTVALMERDMILDTSPANEQDRIMARITSYEFLSAFIIKEDLRKVIFASEWDEEKKKWKTDDEELISLPYAVKILNEKMLNAEIDIKTGLLNLSIIASNPEYSAALTNKFVDQFKSYQRNIVLDELNKRRDYLEDRLNKTTNLEFQRSIYRMLESQLSAEALINVRGNYPLEVIAPAVPPLLKSSPKRLLYSIVVFVATLFLGCCYLIGQVIYQKTSVQLKKYGDKDAKLNNSKKSMPQSDLPNQQASSNNNLPNNNDLNKDRWIDC